VLAWVVWPDTLLEVKDEKKGGSGGSASGDGLAVAGGMGGVSRCRGSMMKKSNLALAFLILSFPVLSFANLTYTPVVRHSQPAPKLAGLAVQCVPIKGNKPKVKHEDSNAVTLLCKPQYLHMRGIEASKANLTLLFAGKGYDANLKVYRLKYHTIGNGKILQGTEKVGDAE